MKPRNIVLTVGQLRESIKDIPDDTPVYYQRIEDKYFENHGWETDKLVWNYSKALGYIYSEYIPAFSAYLHSLNFRSNEDVFVINAHY